MTAKYISAYLKYTNVYLSAILTLSMKTLWHAPDVNYACMYSPKCVLIIIYLFLHMASYAYWLLHSRQNA